VHKISTRNHSKNGSRPLWGLRPQVENHLNSWKAVQT